MSDFTGYNPDRVKDLRDSVNTISKKVATTITDEIKGGIVDKIAEAWYTPEGKEYFEAFKTAVSKAGPVIKEVFDVFVKGLETAANNWADNTKAKQISLKGVDSIKLDLNVSAIKKDKNGDIGIIESQATSVANGTAAVRTLIQTQLGFLAGTLEANSAFLGKNQAFAVHNCFRKIQTEVVKIFRFLDEDGDGQSLKSAITAAVRKYGDVGTSTTSYFNSDN